MSSHANEGLLLSLLIYASAVLGVLTLVMLPVYYATRPTVIRNVSAERVHEILATRRPDGSFPVARLREPDFVGATAVAELNARSKKDQLAQHKVSQVAQRNRVAERARVAQRAYHDRSARAARNSRTRRAIADARPVGPNRPGPFQQNYMGATY
jgi:hypothetical protein